MYVLVHREIKKKKTKEYVKIRLSIFLCPRAKKTKKKNGQLANNDNRRDFERQNHLTCFLISCLSQLIIQVTLMTSLLCIHCFQRNKRKKRATLIRILRNPSVFSKDRHALEDQLIISFFPSCSTNYRDKKKCR